MSKPTTAVVTKEGGVPSLTKEDLELMAAGAEKGTESFKLSQTIVPYLFIVQGASDYVKRGQAKFIDAAREGDIMDSLLLRPMPEAYVVVCKFEDHSTEWRPNRGGLVKQHFTDHTKYFASAKKSADDFDGMPRTTVEGHDITLVPTYYCLLVNPESGRGRPVVLTMAGTQAKKSRRLNGLIDALEFTSPEGMTQTAPIYSQVFKLTTVPEQYQTRQGPATIAGWKVDQVGLTLKAPGGRDLWQHAQQVREQVEQGIMRMAAPTERDVTGEATATTQPGPTRGGSRPASDVAGEDIPF